MKDKILINLDCVSDGDHLMLVINRPASKTPHFRENIQSSFEKLWRTPLAKLFTSTPPPGAVFIHPTRWVSERALRSQP